MADQKNNKPRIRGVDDAGIRLAPPPINNAGYHVMPTVMQEYVIEPHLSVDEPKEDKREVSTADDFQPRREEANKKWKRQKRAKNMIAGAIAIVVSVVVLLPYILGAIGTKVSAPFRFSLESYNVVGKWISAFKQTAALGWKGDGIKEIWLSAVPSMILTIGILAVLINAIKSLFALFGAIKPVKYGWGAFVNLVCVLAIFVASLVGAPAIGIDKIDFMADFIHGFKASELFTLMAFGAGYTVICALLSLVNRDKFGYLK